MKKLLVAAMMFGMVAPAAMAEDFFARGDWNGFGLDDPLNFVGGVEYAGTVTALTPGDEYEYKVANEDFSIAAPGSNGKVAADANGEIAFHYFDQDSWDDGWMPADKLRVGYEDPGLFGWEIMGAFNGWADGLMSLTDMGDGLYAGDLVVADPGDYEWKFRKQDDWSISIGDDFGNAAANNLYTTTEANELVHFELDLPNGRWMAIPEPSTIALMALAGVFAIRRRR